MYIIATWLNNVARACHLHYQQRAGLGEERGARARVGEGVSL